MQDQQAAPLYRVWGADNVAYGPFELPTLVTWVKQRRVTAESWVFVQDDRRWMKAVDLTELKMFFDTKTPEHAAPSGGVVKPENLRRIKLFADLYLAQLESVLHYLEAVRVAKFSRLFSQGDQGDAMYFILEGELRAALTVDGKETTLATLHVGDFFGEVALLSEGPRAADILANEDSVLLKLPAKAFETIISEAPALATPFLLAISRSIAARLLDLDRKYVSSIRSARVASELHL
jgi:hypothetical protein